MNKLKFWRIERGLTQMELAQASGITRWAIHLVETNIRCLSANEAEILASTLGLASEQLFIERRADFENGK